MATTSNAASDYFEQSALEHLFGYSSASAPSTIEISLHYGDPLDDNSAMNELDSSNDPGYTRVSLTPMSDLTSGSDGSGYSIYPSSTVTFTASGGNWTNAPTYAGVYDDNSNLLFRAEIDDGASNSFSALTDGQSLEFASGSLKFKLS